MAFPGQVVAYGRALEMLTQQYTDYDALPVSVSLHTSAYSPNTSHAYSSDLRGEVVGGGYSRKKLQGREVVFDEAVQRIQLKATRVTWSMVTLTARWAVIRCTTEGQTDLLAWVDLGAPRQVTNASLTIGWQGDMIMEVEGVGSS